MLQSKAPSALRERAEGDRLDAFHAHLVLPYGPRDVHVGGHGAPGKPSVSDLQQADRDAGGYWGPACQGSRHLGTAGRANNFPKSPHEIRLPQGIAGFAVSMAWRGVLRGCAVATQLATESSRTTACRLDVPELQRTHATLQLPASFRLIARSWLVVNWRRHAWQSCRCRSWRCVARTREPGRNGCEQL